MVDHMQFLNEYFRWSISFTRLVHDWEVDFVTFFDLLYSNRLRQGGEDKLCWIPSNKRKFEVRLFYHVLSTLVGSTLPFVFEELGSL